MLEIYPATYMDDFGTEITTIENDGKQLSMVIRDVKFEGTDFDSLEPELESDNPKCSLFTLATGALSNCILEFQMPIFIASGEETFTCPMDVHLKLGKPRQNGGIDEEYVKLKLHFRDQLFISPGKSGWFDDELYGLQKGLPEGCYIKCCLNCAFSEYSPYGYGLFGGLACFRDNKAGFLNVRSKGELFQVWKTMTEYVQETYLCDEFQSKQL